MCIFSYFYVKILLFTKRYILSGSSIAIMCSDFWTMPHYCPVILKLQPHNCKSDMIGNMIQCCIIAALQWLEFFNFEKSKNLWQFKIMHKAFFFSTFWTCLNNSALCYVMSQLETQQIADYNSFIHWTHKLTNNQVIPQKDAFLEYRIPSNHVCLPIRMAVVDFFFLHTD